MFGKFHSFIAQDDGAVTVDWVVLTAGIVGLGAVIYVGFAEPLRELDTSTGERLEAKEVTRPEVVQQ